MSELLNDPNVPKNATVGDDNLVPREPEVYRVDETVKAQVTGPPAEAPKTVKVTETAIRLDEVITDSHSPLAVQIPDAGMGRLDLPIHRLAKGVRPEDVFSGKAEADSVHESIHKD